MKKLVLSLLVLAGACVPLYGQQFDAAFGVSTLVAPSPTSTLFGLPKQSLSGGAYPVFSGDYLLFHNFGVGGEIAWKASRGLYQGFQPYRPVLWDLNGIYAPPLGRHAAVELMAGVGALSSRFYQNQYVCGFTGCTNYISSNHFAGHFGGGLRLYVKGGFFIRPEAHVYLIRNNEEFDAGHVTRVGASIGYSFGGTR